MKLIHIISLLAAMLILAGNVWAEYDEDVIMANQLRKDGKKAECIVVLEKIISDYPERGKDVMAATQFSIGMIYIIGEDGDSDISRINAAREFQKVIDNYPNSKSEGKAYLYLGRIHYNLGNMTDAKNCLSKVESYNEIPYLKALAKYYLALVLNNLGEFSDAQKAFMNASGKEFGSLEFQTKIFSRINTVHVNTEDYKAYLEKLLLIVPVSEESSEFLGKVKSKLEVIK